MRIPRVGAALPTGDVIWSCSSLPFEHEQGPYVLLGHDPSRSKTEISGETDRTSCPLVRRSCATVFMMLASLHGHEPRRGPVTSRAEAWADGAIAPPREGPNAATGRSPHAGKQPLRIPAQHRGLVLPIDRARARRRPLPARVFGASLP